MNGSIYQVLTLREKRHERQAQLTAIEPHSLCITDWLIVFSSFKRSGADLLAELSLDPAAVRLPPIAPN